MASRGAEQHRLLPVQGSQTETAEPCRASLPPAGTIRSATRRNPSTMLQISQSVRLPEEEIEIQFVRAQGPGGQNVNKLATAAHLRFDIPASSLPEFYKTRLLNLQDRRITKEGVIVIKAGRYRSQDKNREEALQRLCELIRSVGQVRKKRLPTKATRASRVRRMDSKRRHGQTKALRRKVRSDDH